MLRIVVGITDLTGLPSAEGNLTTLAANLRALRDAGHEVIHPGPGQTPDQVVQAALQEDADVIGLTAPSPELRRQLVELLLGSGADDIEVRTLDEILSRPGPGTDLG